MYKILIIMIVFIGCNVTEPRFSEETALIEGYISNSYGNPVIFTITSVIEDDSKIIQKEHQYVYNYTNFDPMLVRQNRKIRVKSENGKIVFIAEFH